jgi:hypothetical protein
LIESDLFDPEQLFLTSPADDQVDKIPPSAAAAIHIKKLELIRVSREKNLRAIFPELKAGHSYHFISAGDIDAVSYLTMLIEKCGPFDEFYGSTWTMSRQDCELLDRYLSDKLIKSITFFTGEYFAKRETSVYASLLQVINRHGGRIKMFKNHCKILAVHNQAAEFWAVAEGSANFTTNPRSEQTTITLSRELFEFYKYWFEDLLHNAERAGNSDDNRSRTVAGRDTSCSGSGNRSQSDRHRNDCSGAQGH